MAVAADAFFGEPTRALEVAGVTGTNGKTTTTFLLGRSSRPQAARPGSSARSSGSSAASGAPRRTRRPRRSTCSASSARCSTPATGASRVEASSHGSRCTGSTASASTRSSSRTCPRTTSTCTATMEDYYQAKRRLFTGAQPPPAAVNVGDEHGRRLALELARRAARRSSRSGCTDAAEIRPRGSSWGRRAAASALPGSRSRRRCAGASTSRTSSARSPPAILLDVDDEDIATGVRR